MIFKENRMRFYLPGYGVAMDFISRLDKACGENENYLKERPLTKRAMHLLSFVYKRHSNIYHLKRAITG